MASADVSSDVGENENENEIADEESSSDSNSFEDDTELDFEESSDSDSATQGVGVIQFLRGRQQNLMNEFTDVDTFIISMDSLFIEIMLHDYLSWILGGQSLVVVYMIESFLKSLKDKGGRFQLVWFDDLESCFQGNSTVMLMREIVKKHFNSIASLRESIFIFQSPFIPCWDNHLKQFSPSFMFCSVGTLNQDQFRGFDSALFKDCMLSLIITCLNANVATVNFDGIQQNEATFFAYCVRPLKIRPADFIASRKNWEKLLSMTDIEVLSHQSVSPNMQIISFWSVVIKQFLEINHDKDYETYCNTFLKAVKFQTLVHLELRAQSLRYRDIPIKANLFIKKLCSIAAKTLRCLAEPVQFPVYDLIDGRFFAYFLNVEYAEIKFDCCSTTFAEADQSCTAEQPQVNFSFYQMRPLKHKLFEMYAVDIAKAINSSLGDTVTNCIETPTNDSSVFHDIRHWHSGKLIEEDFSQNNKKEWRPQKGNKWAEIKKNKNKQNLAKWYDFYGMTLEGRTQNVSFHPPMKELVQKKTSKKAEQMKYNNIKRTLETKTKKEVEAIENLVKNKVQIPNFAKTTKGKATTLYHQSVLLKQQILDQHEHDLVKRRIISIDLFLKLDELLHKSIDGEKLVNSLNKKNQITAENMWQDLGFESQMNEHRRESVNCQGLYLDMDLLDYRLAHASESIEVLSNPIIDNRIEGFVPDEWQIKLLNVVDRDQSALIIAPTSAGKTFISYYCIEKVLRNTDDGIVVYVSPTKAVANQVAATINARFKHKNLPPGQTLFGIFTRDYRKDVLTSRVLVTVPQCLEIFFLSSQSHSWRQKLKYAIFDEVHCIGGGVGDILGSEVWEHIILLAPCPFLALSATVGNVHVLHDWLNQASQSKQSPTEVQLVHYNERYSELELFLFNIFDAKSEQQLFELNPLAVCHVDMIKQFGIPADQQLTAKQIYNLWKAIYSINNDIGAALKPRAFFGIKDSLLRCELREYENKLKNCFKDIVDKGLIEETNLTNDLFGDVHLQLTKRSKIFNGLGIAWNRIVDLVLCLQKRSMLPCLCFSDDRLLCEEFAKKVLHHFMREEKKFHQESSKKDCAWAQKKGAKHFNKTLKRYRDSLIPEEKLDSLICHVKSGLFDREKFKFAKFKLTKLGANRDWYRKIADRLKWNNGTLQSTKMLLHCIKRGIGYHHLGRSKMLDPLTYHMESGLFDSEEVKFAKFKFPKIGANHELNCKINDRLKWKNGALQSTKMLLHCIKRGIGYHHSGMSKTLNSLIYHVESGLFDSEEVKLAKFKLTKLGTDCDLYRKVIDKLQWKDGDSQSTKMLLQCIKRGIGYHHSGMSKTQRESVEILFRSGYLQIVFTTATLALGIHMPCKTVVMAIDSPFLTPLQYRQMIGRAGRRGFDKSGNVILFSIPTKKITRLLTAALPNLRANLPFTVSFILRLLALVASVPESETASCLNDICALLQQPFIVHTLASQQETLQKQLEHYFVFACHFLSRIHLINENLQPIGPAGIVTHLSYHEPGNFIFTYFLQKGTFHSLCEDYSGFELDEKLLLILCHLFTHTLVPYTNNTKVILDPLPTDFIVSLNDYNKEVCNFYVSFLKCLADNLFPFCDPDENLPYSGTLIRSTDYHAQKDSDELILQNLRSSKLTNVKIGGPIFSITGKEDSQLDLLNLKLVYPLRKGIYFDRGFVPVGTFLQKNHRGEAIALNAFALNFWKHEDRRKIVIENDILDGDAYYMLNDFNLMLKSIKVALDVKRETDNVVQAFTRLSDAYESKFNDAWHS